MTAIPLPLISFDIPGAPREETRGYDGSMCRFGSPVAAPDLGNAPELGRTVTQPTAELLARIAELEDQLAVSIESESYTSRRYLEELAISKRMLDEVTRFSGEIVERDEKIAVLRDRLRTQDRLIANMMLEAHQLKIANTARAVEIFEQQARLDALTRARADAPDTDVVDPHEWYCDPTPTPRVTIETLAEAVGGGR